MVLLNPSTTSLSAGALAAYVADDIDSFGRLQVAWLPSGMLIDVDTPYLHEAHVRRASENVAVDVVGRFTPEECRAIGISE
jgi:hypothetical protein